jgi:hypothetical protein
MYSATAKRARARVVNDWRWYISFFRAAKKDSAAALSQHTPVRPRLRRIPFLAVNVANSADVYWVPGSRQSRHMSPRVAGGRSGVRACSRRPAAMLV